MSEERRECDHAEIVQGGHALDRGFDVDAIDTVRNQERMVDLFTIDRTALAPVHEPQCHLKRKERAQDQRSVHN